MSVDFGPKGSDAAAGYSEVEESEAKLVESPEALETGSRLSEVSFAEKSLPRAATAAEAAARPAATASTISAAAEYHSPAAAEHSSVRPASPRPRSAAASCSTASGHQRLPPCAGRSGDARRDRGRGSDHVAFVVHLRPELAGF